MKKLTQQQIGKLRLVGQLMSNLCYNLGQEKNPPFKKHWAYYAKEMKELSQRWDDIFKVTH